MRANLSFATVPNLPDEARAQLSADVASLRSEVERILGKGTREALAIIASIDDDTHEALTRGLANLPTFQRNGGNVQAWIATIAHNLRIDRARAGVVLSSAVAVVHGVRLVGVAEEPLIQATACAADTCLSRGAFIRALCDRFVALVSHYIPSVYGVASRSLFRFVASGTARLE